MYTFSPMMVANSRKHHCCVRTYTREVLVLSINLEIQTKHYPLVFRNHRGDEARIKKTWYNQVPHNYEQELNQESLKRQKIGEGSEPAEESKDKESDELSQEQLQQLMIIVPEEGMNVEALQTKYPIIDWEVYTEDSRMYWKIIRVGNHTEVYQIFEDMLKNFDRDDLVKLWSLVHERFNSTEPTEDKEREL
ncbi:hypothetical protein Tco_0614101 [Tanacetum coccineum]